MYSLHVQAYMYKPTCTSLHVQAYMYNSLTCTISITLCLSQFVNSICGLMNERALLLAYSSPVSSCYCCFYVFLYWVHIICQSFPVSLLHLTGRQTISIDWSLSQSRAAENSEYRINLLWFMTGGWQDNFHTAFLL